MKKLSIKDMAICAVLGAMMFASKIVFEVLPNIHLIGAIIIITTVVYRAKAILSIYVFVFLAGLFYGFPLWWYPHLYIWLPLFLVVMLLPQNLSGKKAIVIYCTVGALHGLFFGTLYAPFQALFFGLDFKGMVSWIIVGLPADLIHAAGNSAASLLVVPVANALKRVK